jgi:hypothetical protein
MLYRVRQFFSGMFGRVSEEELGLVRKYLSERQQELFFRLPRHEQHHAACVGRDILKEYGEAERELIIAGFLHDIGKIDSGLNIFNKSIMVLLNKVFPGAITKLEHIGIVNAYFNHPLLAVKLLKGEDERLIYYVLNHHNYGIRDEKLEALQRIDSRY